MAIFLEAYLEQTNGIDRVQGDYMGMLATVINGLALQSSLRKLDYRPDFKLQLIWKQLLNHILKEKLFVIWRKKRIVIFVPGTGNPFFTTDSAAVLRAIEIEADVILKGTRVDGIYDCDPEKNNKAKKFHELKYDDAISKNLKIMDSTAFTLSKENKLPIIVFDINKTGNLKKIIQGKIIGTKVN